MRYINTELTKQKGFTIVELLIVIVVIGILAAITIVAFNGIQARARDSSTLSAITSVNKAIQLYHAQHGEYPKTISLTNGRSDSNCNVGTKQADWVPGLVPDFIPSLPSSPTDKRGYNNDNCYLYASDGTSYVLSAWRMLETGPQTSTYYRRLGFREGWTAVSNPISYNCANGSNQAYWDNYYKHSYTFSNITTCNES